jgi:predicted lipoprotein
VVVTAIDIIKACYWRVNNSIINITKNLSKIQQAEELCT